MEVLEQDLQNAAEDTQPGLGDAEDPQNSSGDEADELMAKSISIVGNETASFVV